MSTPNPTPPSAEAMAALHELFDHSSYGWQEEALVIDRHLAPLREKITGLQGLDIQNEEIIRTLTDDRDALRKCVAELEAALAQEAFDSNVSILSLQTINGAMKEQLTVLQTTVQALEGDRKRLDWLEAGHGNLYRIGMYKWCLGAFGPKSTIRETIDTAMESAALATH